MKSTEVPDSEYKAAMSWFFDDYREIAGVRLPFYIQIEERLFTREYLFEAIEANVPVDDALFTRPASSRLNGTKIEDESVEGDES